MSSRRARLRMGLGQSTGSSWTEFLTNLALGPTAWVQSAYDWWESTGGTPPGVTPSALLSAAWTGNVPSSVDTALKQQGTAAYIQAGMDPTTAAATASSDVDTALTTYTGTGGLGVTWTGAAPSSPTFAEAAITGAGNATGGISDLFSWLGQNWIWLALGGIGFWYVSRKL